jgi:hypothetical protein
MQPNAFDFLQAGGKAASKFTLSMLNDPNVESHCRTSGVPIGKLIGMFFTGQFA